VHAHAEEQARQNLCQNTSPKVTSMGASLEMRSASARMLDGNRLFLRTAKTGCPVYCALPDFVAEALRTLPRLSERIRNLLFVRLEPASEVDLGKDLH
jgi:hypothetical protein